MNDPWDRWKKVTNVNTGANGMAFELNVMDLFVIQHILNVPTPSPGDYLVQFQDLSFRFFKKDHFEKSYAFTRDDFVSPEEMRVGSGQFLHEILTARKSALILDKAAGHMTLRVFGWGDDRVTDIFKTPAAGKLKPEYYDSLYIAVSNAILEITKNHPGIITVSYVGA